jgi:peptidoglycan hydrolase FlgJ
MQMDAINAAAQSTAGQTSYDNAKVAADAAQFADVLKKAQTNLNDVQGASGTVSAEKSAAQDKKLREVCTGFEEMFMDMMYKQMRETVPKDSLFGESNADNILESMRDSAVMKQAAASGGVGLADMLYRQMKQQSGAAIQGAKK